MKVERTGARILRRQWGVGQQVVSKAGEEYGAAGMSELDARVVVASPVVVVSPVVKVIQEVCRGLP